MSVGLATVLLLAVRVGVFPADAPSSKALASALRHTGLFDVAAVKVLSNPGDIEGLGVLVLAPAARLDESGLIAVDAFLQAGGGVVALGKSAVLLPPFVMGGTSVWGKRMTLNFPGGRALSLSHPDPFHFVLFPSPISSPVSADEMGRVTGVMSQAGRGKLIALGDPITSGIPTGGQFRALLWALRLVSPPSPPGPTSAYIPLAAARARLFDSLLSALDRARSVEWRRCPALDRIARAAGRLKGGEPLRAEALGLKASLRKRVKQVCELVSREAWRAIERLYEEGGVEFLPEVDAKCSEIASLPRASLEKVDAQIEAALPHLERELKALQRGFAGLLPVRRPRGWEARRFPFVILSARPASEALVGSCAEVGAAASSPKWTIRAADLSERSHVLWFTRAPAASPEAVRAALPSHLLSRNSLAGAIIEGVALPERVSPEELAEALLPLLRGLDIRADARDLARRVLSGGSRAPASPEEVLAVLELERLRRAELARTLDMCARAARMRREDLIVCPLVRGPDLGALSAAAGAPWVLLDPGCGGSSAAFLAALLKSASRGRALLSVPAEFAPSPSALSEALFLSIAFADGPALRPFELVSPYKPPGIFPAPGASPPPWDGKAWEGVKAFRARTEAAQKVLLRSAPGEEIGLLVSLRTLDLNGALGEEERAQYLANLAGWFELLQRAGLPARPVFAEDLDTRRLSEFKALIVPDAKALPPGLEEALRGFVEEGGALVATSDTSVYDPFGRKRPDYGLTDLFGVRRRHEARGALSVVLASEAARALGAGLRRATVDPERRYVVVASAGRRIWARFSSGHPAIVAHSAGRGICVFIAYSKIGLCYEGAPLSGDRLDPTRPFKRGLPELVRAVVEGAMTRAKGAGWPTVALQNVPQHLLFSLRTIGGNKYALHLVNLHPGKPVEGVRVRVLGEATAYYLADGSRAEAKEVGGFTWLAVRPVRDYECLIVERRARG